MARSSPAQESPTPPSAGRGPGNDQPDRRLSGDERIDFQWKVIQRFDAYIATTNTKAATLLTLDTFIFGAIVLKWGEVAQYFGPFRAAIVIANLLLAGTAATALVSLWFALQAVVPVLNSAKEPTRYHSLVFFGHVAEHAQPDHYVEAVTAAGRDAVADDLAKQAHALAGIACSKFWWLTWATRLVVFVQLPAFLAMIATLLVSAFCLYVGGGQHP